MAVPGIGFVLAVTLYTELMTIDRIATLDQLAAYVGLVPSVTSSDEHEINHGLTCRHNAYLRYLLVEAAWVAIRKDTRLLQTFTQFTRRMHTQKAIVRIAKKLLSRIRAVWKHQTAYRMQPVTT
jgi:transposase